jgi:hypothetical protein
MVVGIPLMNYFTLPRIGSQRQPGRAEYLRMDETDTASFPAGPLNQLTVTRELAPNGAVTFAASGKIHRWTRVQARHGRYDVCRHVAFCGARPASAGRRRRQGTRPEAD